MRALLLSLFLCGGVQATILPDSSTSYVYAGSVAGFNHTTTGIDRIVFGIIHARNSMSSVSGISYNGVAMTLGVTITGSGTPGDQTSTFIYYLLNPPKGACYFTATVTGGNGIVAGTSSFSQVSQDTPIGTPVSFKWGAGLGASCTVASDPNDFVFDALTQAQRCSVTPYYMQTVAYTGSRTGLSAGASWRPGNTSVVTSWGTNGSATQYWTMCAIPLRPASYSTTWYQWFQGSNPWTVSQTGQPPYTIAGTVAVSTTDLGVNILRTDVPFTYTKQGVQILESAGLTATAINVGCCTPFYGSLEVSTSGATVSLGAGINSFKWHISGDSGGTGYAYSSLISISNAASDTGDSCGHLTFGVGANTYPILVPCNQFDNLNGDPLTLYFYSKGSTDIHWLATRKR